MLTDLNLPIFKYESSDPYENGLQHGKAYKEAIKELVKIRTNLLLKRSPHLENKLDEFAKEQFRFTKDFSNDLALELEGIAEGSECSLTDIIILNNYTDFRDIQLPDEGCTAISYIGDDISLAGQTWDMHQSAKNYLMIIEVHNESTQTKEIIYTVCGCLGLMAMNSYAQFVGVNNINVVDGENGIIWPALIRKLSTLKTQKEVIDTLMNAKVTSGHNYLISDGSNAYNYEITPTVKEIVPPQSEEIIFHTNHCLNERIISVEDKKNISKTTHKRYELAKKYAKQITTEKAMFDFLTSHDGHPISICSHFSPEGANDPSQTCGGALYNYKTQMLKIWRGCREYDDNYRYVEIPLPLVDTK